MTANLQYGGFKSQAIVREYSFFLRESLHHEMANSVDHPLRTHYRISGTELDNYRDSHSSKAVNALYPRKAAQDF
jgi:hypothetical protein